MLSDKFWIEFKGVTPSQFVDVTAELFEQKFLPEVRADALKVVLSALSDKVPADEDEEESDPPRLVALPDFMEEVGEPPEAVVPHFIPSKKLIALSGAAKQGKSLIALQIMSDVSRGTPLFGEFEIKRPGSVVYFGFEDGAHEIKTRLTERGDTDIPNFYICWQPFDFGKPEGMHTFKKLIKTLPELPEVVVIDTARHAFDTLKDWNDNTEVGRVLRPLLAWSHKNCTVILITHNNKDKFASGANKIAGAGALLSTCDGYMMLENQKVLDNGDLIWDWEMRGRGVKAQNCKLQMDTNTLAVKYLNKDAIKDAASQEHKNAREISKGKILDFAKERERFCASDVENALSYSDRYVREILHEMANAGTLLMVGTMKTDNSKRPVRAFAVNSEALTNNNGTGGTCTSMPSSVIPDGGAGVQRAAPTDPLKDFYPDEDGEDGTDEAEWK